jgi:hypothetical protein
MTTGRGALRQVNVQQQRTVTNQLDRHVSAGSWGRVQALCTAVFSPHHEQGLNFMAWFATQPAMESVDLVRQLKR